MDQMILYRSTGDKEGEVTVFPNFELFPYFNIDVQPELVNNNFNDKKESLSLLNQFTSDNSFKKLKNEI